MAIHFFDFLLQSSFKFDPNDLINIAFSSLCLAAKFTGEGLKELAQTKKIFIKQTKKNQIHFDPIKMEKIMLLLLKWKLYFTVTEEFLQEFCLIIEDVTNFSNFIEETQNHINFSFLKISLSKFNDSIIAGGCLKFVAKNPKYSHISSQIDILFSTLSSLNLLDVILILNFRLMR